MEENPKSTTKSTKKQGNKASVGQHNRKPPEDESGDEEDEKRMKRGLTGD